MQELALAAQQTNAWACYDCGKCTASCPISRSGLRYSPRKHVLATNLGHDKALFDNGTLRECLTCGVCDHRCPVDVRYTELMLTLRTLAYKQDAEPQCPHGGALLSVMRMMAGGGTQQDRLGWLTGDLETESTTGEVFFFTGCTMYYDAFFPELGVGTLNGTRAAVHLLNALKITPVVSKDERCCGHDLLWNGDRESFEALAKHNVALVSKSGAAVVVTPCAECVRTWRLDYTPFFSTKPPRIVHMTEFLAEKMAGLKLETKGPRRVTFQDPCRLGRHLGVYDAPRAVLSALPGVDLVEMRRSSQNALCCAGGTWSSCGQFSKKIQVERLREARATGADVLVTACPKCQVHFRCAMDDPNLGDEIAIEVRDVAEIVAAALG